MNASPPATTPARRLLGVTALALVASAATLSHAQPATTTTTVTTGGAVATTAPTPAVMPAPTRVRRTSRHKSNPAARPFYPLTGTSPIGTPPPRVSPGRPAGAITTAPAVTPSDPGDAGTSETVPDTPH